MHYNGFPAPKSTALPPPAIAPDNLKRQWVGLNAQLPNGIEFEWTELTYQKFLPANDGLISFHLCFLVLPRSRASI